VADTTGVVAKWDAAHYYSPAPRHRRRLILKWIARLEFKDVLDAGCAQPYLLEEIAKRRQVRIYGCDVSEDVIAQNRRRLPQAEFEVVDLSGSPWPEGRRFDLVICSEVIEHIEDWTKALANVASMAARHLLVTVPSGRVYAIDRHVGHFRHFRGEEVNRELARCGFRVIRARHWGMPMHTLYKVLINNINPRAMYETFAEGRYSFGKRAIAEAVYLMFFANDLFRGGGQYLVLAERVR